MRIFVQSIVTVAALSLSATVLADAGHSHGPNIGKPGHASNANRSIEILLTEMTFKPAELQVKAGETIHFVVKNQGQLLHEFNLGTAAMHTAHREEMAEMMSQGTLTPTGMDHSKMGHGHMQHDDPNSVLVEPGKTAELTWTFPRSGTLAFACNVPGHSEAGMVGQIRIGN